MAATATPAVHALRKHGLAFTEHDTGTRTAAAPPCRRASSACPSTSRQDAGDGGRGEAAADRPDARRPRGVDQAAGPTDWRRRRSSRARPRSPSATPAIRWAARRRSARASRCRSTSSAASWNSSGSTSTAAAVASWCRSTPGSGRGAGRHARRCRRGDGRLAAVPALGLRVVSSPVAATFAQVSFSDTVRLNTGAPGWPSASTAK